MNVRRVDGVEANVIVRGIVDGYREGDSFGDECFVFFLGYFFVLFVV